MADPHEWREMHPLVLEARDRLSERFKDDRNVTCIAFGPPIRGGVPGDRPACIVYVARKLPLSQLAAERVVPRTLEVRGREIETDVVESGHFYALSATSLATFATFDQRERPALGGISIGHRSITAGTLGCLVHDLRDNNKLSILSNNHVLADHNAASVGDPIYQPGPYDATPVDDNIIATVTRWVDVAYDNSTLNKVDCAVAAVTNDCLVADDIKGKMTRPEAAQPAVGLLFGGSSIQSLVCPINEVVSQLEVEMTAGSSARYQVKPDDAIAPGLAVQKTGRTTEYTTGRITAIDGKPTVHFGPRVAKFEDIIITTPMSQGGDSGSVVCRGGTGSIAFPLLLPCPFLGVAEDLTGVPFTHEWMSIVYARDKYLANTLVGRWLIDTLYLNEQSAMMRAAEARAQVLDDDRAFAQALYSTYAGDMKLALMNPDRDDIRVTEQFLADSEDALARARPYLIPEEADAVQESIALVRERGIVGMNGRQLITMLDEPELLQRLKEIVARSNSVVDPDG